MIVIPRVPNLRPAIAIAAFIFFILSVLSISNYISAKEENIFLEHEKSLVLNELSEMIDSYDSVEILNDTLRAQLFKSKQRLIVTRDSVIQFEPSEALIKKFKSQLKILKLEYKRMLTFANGLESQNRALKKEKIVFEKTLKSRDSIVALIETKYAHLLDTNEANKTLFVSNLNIEGAKRITYKNRVVDTRYANRTRKFYIEFTIVKNPSLKIGPKTFYFQILDSEMNVVSDKGTVNFGKKSLIYSGKKTVKYIGEELNISTIIDKNKDEKLSKGVYNISIFHKGILVSKTSMTLK